ncbi:MAG: ATP-binding cassette domain-containing protein [bacterium]|nr:ATP-binding cassette domain-containing protein [bacterium]
MINVHQLVKKFESGDKELVAVNELSFSVQPGEVFGLLGPNGAGKTTTLRMIIGLLRPDSGYAEVDGFRTTNSPDSVKARIGMVSANDGVYPWLTVREMLLFFADMYGVEPETAAAELERLADLLEFRRFVDQRCITLSTGQKQRLTLARGLIHNPPVVLLDEPTRGLDVVGSKVVFDYIDILREAGKSVIVSTHRLDEAQRLCDRFGLLHFGRFLHEGTLDDLRAATGQQDLVDMFLSFMKADASEAPV